MYIPVMKKDKKEIGWVRIVSSIIVSFIGIVISLFLLDKQAINSDNFVQLISITLLCSFAIAYFNRISEISLLGKFSVRFQEIEKEAEKLLNELQVNVFMMKIDQAIQSGASLGNNSLVRESSREFYEVIQEIKEAGLIKNKVLVSEIRRCLGFLLHGSGGQYMNIIKAGGTFDNKNRFEGIVDPQNMRSLINDDLIENSQNANLYFREDKQKFKDELYLAIDSYENLLRVQKWIEDE